MQSVQRQPVLSQIPIAPQSKTYVLPQGKDSSFIFLSPIHGIAAQNIEGRFHLLGTHRPE